MPSQTHEPDPELTDMLVTFLRDYYRDDVATLAQQYPSDQQSLWVDYDDLYRYDSDLADDLRRRPDTILEYFAEALGKYELPVEINLSGAHVRVYNLPSVSTYHPGEYRSSELEQYISISGQVAKQTQVYPMPERATYECQRCGTPNQVPQDGLDLQEPHECVGCERQGPFQLRHEQSEWTDLQLLEVQVPPEYTNGGEGADLKIRIENDLTDTLDPGDRATIAGTLTAEPPGDGDPGFVPKLEGQAIQMQESDYDSVPIDEHLDEIRAYAAGEYGDPYEQLIASIAPRVIGMEQVKLALALQLFGGVTPKHPDGTEGRGDIHCLLLGDPGTAKSTLLEDIEHKAPCSTYASGKGATAAGLTASVVKDGFGSGQWTLEAGALVIADGGIACVDELDKIESEAVSSMHEALSKQRVNVNKANINATLPAQTALLAAGNPEHGRFLPTKPVAEQIDLGPTLLSRFDLLFMLDDQPDEDSDAEIIEGMVENRQQAIRYSAGTAHGADVEDIRANVPLDVLRAWVAHAKQTVKPRIDGAAVATELKESFKSLRLMNGAAADSPVPITFRKLEGIQRLAEASARVRLSETVEMEDVNRARELIGRSLRDVGMDPEDGTLDVDVIETGTPKSQKDRIQWVYEYIEAEAGTEPVSAQAVIESASEADIGPHGAEYAIEKLKTQGKIYETGSGLRST